MAIYKSSFNQKPQKPEKEKKERAPRALKPEKKAKVVTQTKPKVKINASIVCLVVFSVLFLLCLFPNPIRHVVLGLVGLSVYPVCVLGIFFSAATLAKRQFRVKKRYLAYLVSAVVVVWFIFHLIMTHALKVPLTSYGACLAGTYKVQTTAGGLLFSLISYPLIKVITYVGAYIVSAIALAVLVGLIVDYVFADRSGMITTKTKFDFKEIEDFEKTVVQEEQKKTEPEYIKHEAKRKLGLEKPRNETTVISTTMPEIKPVAPQPTQSRPMSKRDYILTPIEPIIPPEETDDLFLDNNTGYYNSKKIKRENVEEIKPATPQIEEPKPISQPIQQTYFEQSKTEEPEQKEEESYSDIILDETGIEDYDDFVELNSEPVVVQAPEADEEFEESVAEEETEDIASIEEEADKLEEIMLEPEDDDLQALDDTDEPITNYEEIEAPLNEPYIDEYSGKKDMSLGNTNDNEVVRPSVDISKFNLPNNVNKPLENEQIKMDEVKPKQEIPPYVAPNVELLDYLEKVEKISEEKIQDNVNRLEQVLEDFKVPAKVNNVQVGPAVTRYELSMPRGISVNKIVTMADDIAMTLASNGSIRVEAPIPGKTSVGVEVPNDTVTPVSLREVIDSQEFKVRGNPLSFILGKDINGDIIFCNLDKMPHLLVAGSTGSGKSVCLNTMLLSMCYKAGPQDLRLILVDPKMVEFSTYNGLPHLLIPEVITGKEMTINAFDWAIKEMESRYAMFAKNHVVNINEYNKLEMVKSKRTEKLPFIVIVVDELADLMLEAKRELEDRIAKIAAKSRAAGIHLVLATQRPSVDVITGVIKNNLPSRIAFALTSYVDSKTILDGSGAEKLLGKGDMLFKMQDKPEPRRVQGAFVSSTEINRVVDFIKSHNKSVYDDSVIKNIKNPHGGPGGQGGADGGLTKNQEFDPILKDVLRMFIETKQASSSIIQRRYSVGFNRAGRIIEQMERAGFVSPPNGSKPRQVLITMDEYKAIFDEQ